MKKNINEEILDSLSSSFGFYPTDQYLIVELEDNECREYASYGLLTNIGIIIKKTGTVYCYSFKESIFKHTTITRIWVTDTIIIVDALLRTNSMRIKGDEKSNIESLLVRETLVYNHEECPILNSDDNEEKTSETMSKYGLV